MCFGLACCYCCCRCFLYCRCRHRHRRRYSSRLEHRSNDTMIHFSILSIPPHIFLPAFTYYLSIQCYVFTHVSLHSISANRLFTSDFVMEGLGWGGGLKEPYTYMFIEYALKVDVLQHISSDQIQIYSSALEHSMRFMHTIISWRMMCGESSNIL